MKRSNEMKVAKIEKRKKKPKEAETTDIEEYLKQLPPPPEEHAYELKIEKRLKRMLKGQKKHVKRTPKRRNSS